MWPAFCKSPPPFQIHQSIGNWDFWLLMLGCTYIFPHAALCCTSKFFQIPKEVQNWNDWIWIRNLQMNKSEKKLEVFKWIFSHFKTVNLNISFNPVEWIFYHFRRVNFKITNLKAYVRYFFIKFYFFSWGTHLYVSLFPSVRPSVRLLCTISWELYII